MRAKLVNGLIVLAILGSGLLSGIAAGDGHQRSSKLAATEQAIELWIPGCNSENGGCRHRYRFNDIDGDRTGTFETADQPYLDADGTVVGRHRFELLASPNTIGKHLFGFVTIIATIRPGPYTERGTITALGLVDVRSLRDPPGRTSELAITGGTGAYRGATGFLTAAYDAERDDFALTWHVIAVD